MIMRTSRLVSGMARAAMAPLVAGGLLGALLVSEAIAQDNITPIPEGALSALSAPTFVPTLDDNQRAEIGQLVRDYLLENPDVIVEVLSILQSREQQAQQDQQRAAVAAVTENVFDPERDPFIGNVDASITVVEFFDYQCPFCKRLAPNLDRVLEGDDDIRVVFKEFPVFGEESTLAARAALASRNQGMYHDYHLALMKNRGRLSERVVMRLAERVGLDMDQLRADMESPEIQSALQANFQLAQRLGVRGTPSFIINDEVIPGAVDVNTMRRLIQAKRRS